MADLSFIVGLVGNVISILVFASPIGTFRRVVKKKSTESFKWQPYVTTLMSTSLWTYYGLLKTNGLLVVTVNGAGTVLQAIYVILYLIYTSKDTRIYMAKMVGLLNVGVIGVVILVTHLALHGSLRLLVMGSLCAALTIGMYASPLYAMKMVMKTKSVEYMPFSLSFFLFLNAGIWSIYSVLVRDIFILIPNTIGFVLGSAQLVIYFIYKKKGPNSAKETDIERAEEEGSAQFVDHMEMQNRRKDEEYGSSKHLNKGRSLPKLYMARQNSFSGILKTLSLSPNELTTYWQKDGYDAI
ncbi:bidirectional sugar transporter SWEET16-like isoform X1 [Dendrobium catenatum]|uniref:Bidirectional sugar transporter SWEET n=1 Tax=Dendrobium catenatum TaxID=906689 RepID=A0A2I0VDV4_9ASPA|nr:bidirectional sugar transporter SWEET16-like isoform X1 [Dendrobium catenatum]PKU61581.1 Bidirectional sugar transporter SWEET16 [Dendrobium catenatum]